MSTKTVKKVNIFSFHLFSGDYMSVNIDEAVKVYNALMKLSAIADKYNELINMYRDLLGKVIEIEIPRLGSIPVEPRKFREFVPQPVPACIESGEEFNEIYFGKRICLRHVDGYTTDIRCYSSKMTIANLIELACNVSDVLEKLAKELDDSTNVLSKAIESLKTIVAESKLLS
jgi:hypothetical protein